VLHPAIFLVSFVGAVFAVKTLYLKRFKEIGLFKEIILLYQNMLYICVKFCTQICTQNLNIKQHYK